MVVLDKVSICRTAGFLRDVQQYCLVTLTTKADAYGQPAGYFAPIHSFKKLQQYGPPGCYAGHQAILLRAEADDSA